MSSIETCPDCEYESDSMAGVKRHYGQVHEGTMRGVVVDCAHCGDETRKDEYKLERSENLFCSTECHDAWRAENVSGEDAGGWQGKTVEVECGACGSTTEKYECRTEQSEKHFCDESCYSEWKRDNRDIMMGSNNPLHGVTGPDHPAWKGGHDQEWRREVEWRRTARQIYRRDDYTCQQCGAQNVELHAHHEQPVHDGGAKYDHDNLVTLCEQCHIDEHR